MKRLGLIIAILMVLGVVTFAQAALIDRGVDVLGNHLIYDSDQNITWYDFVKGGDTWGNQMLWADTLSVTLTDGRSFSDWRLPTTPGSEYGYLNEGEMGHLCYDELGNVASASGGLNVNVGPFANLQSNLCYWYGSEYSQNPSYAWAFIFAYGWQYPVDKLFDVTYYSALAVHSGDVVGNAVPEPATMLLLGLGLMGLVGIRRKI